MILFAIVAGVQLRCRPDIFVIILFSCADAIFARFEVLSMMVLGTIEVN